MESNFKNRQEFQEQCEQWVYQLHMATITGRSLSVEEVLNQISSRLHVSEGNDLIGEE